MFGKRPNQKLLFHVHLQHHVLETTLSGTDGGELFCLVPKSHRAVAGQASRIADASAPGSNQRVRAHSDTQQTAGRHEGGYDPKFVRRDQPPDNPEVREEMKAIASKRRRFGYRRIGVLLERKGMIMNHKKLYRL
jgi:hypothetical protein